MAPVKVEVIGRSKIYSPAELAALSIDVRHEAPDKDVVAKNVMAASAHLRGILDELAAKNTSDQQRSDAAVTEWSNSSLSTGSYIRYDKTEAGERSYNASMTYQVTFRDFSKLGDLAAQILSTDYVEIQNIDWQLSQATIDKLETQSRHEAVKNALKKAADYGSAIGVSGLEVTSVKDVPDQHGGAMPFAMARAGLGGGGGGGPSLNFEPEKVCISCEVVVVLEKQ